MSSATAPKSSKKSSAKRPRKDPHRVITDVILEKLREGVAPWRQPWATTGGLPVNLSTSNEYRGVNILLFMLGGWGDRHWLTYKQAETLGGQVRKGERGTPGLRWLETKRRVKPEHVAMLKERGETVLFDDDGPYTARKGWTTFTAFNVLQIDGIDRPDTPAITWDPIERGEQVLRGYEGGPQIIEGGDSAQYRHNTDSVYVPDRGRFTDAGAYYHATFHELVHSTGVATRLDRDMTGEFGTATYAREELVAEIGAAMLCARVGLVPPVDNSAAYIANWLTVLENDHKLVIPAAQAAQKAVDLILGATER